jgi:hypothetical protein
MVRGQAHPGLYSETLFQKEKNQRKEEWKENRKEEMEEREREGKKERKKKGERRGREGIKGGRKEGREGGEEGREEEKDREQVSRLFLSPWQRPPALLNGASELIPSSLDSGEPCTEGARI